MGRQIGYARVSTDDRHGKAQKVALEAVPCDLLFFEQESGANRERPGSPEPSGHYALAIHVIGEPSWVGARHL
jgi:hypothetical protein